jgi:hypothetical protein
MAEERIQFRITADDSSARAAFNRLAKIQEQIIHNQILMRKISLAAAAIGANAKDYQEYNRLRILNSGLHLTKSLGDLELKRRREQERFNFSWLSLLFTGMAVNRMLGQYVTKVTDMLGINDLWNISMQMLTLDALMPMLPTIYSLLGAFAEWAGQDGWLQKLVGGSILATWATAGLLEVMGQAGMAIQGFLMLPVAVKQLQAWTIASWGAVIPTAILAAKLIIIGAAIAVVVWGLMKIVDAYRRLDEVLSKVNANTTFGELGRDLNQVNPVYRMAQSYGVAPVNNTVNISGGGYMDEFANRRLGDTIAGVLSYKVIQNRKRE